MIRKHMNHSYSVAQLIFIAVFVTYLQRSQTLTSLDNKECKYHLSSPQWLVLEIQWALYIKLSDKKSSVTYRL